MTKAWKGKEKGMDIPKLNSKPGAIKLKDDPEKKITGLVLEIT